MINNTSNRISYSGINNIKPTPIIRSYNEFVLMVSLIMSSLFFLVPSIKDVHAQSSYNWFVGKGAQENTYYTYKIQHHDVNQGRLILDDHISKGIQQ